MTIEDIKIKIDDLISAIKEYKAQPDFDEIQLEMKLDWLMCCLPRDIVYVEWFDRSDIASMINTVDEPCEEQDLVDKCMEELDRFSGSIMENETVQQIIDDTVRDYKQGEE